MPTDLPYRDVIIEDRIVYKAWLRRIILLWGTVAAVMAVVCAIIAVDSTTTPEQRSNMAVTFAPPP
jgi:hypothetical protein